MAEAHPGRRRRTARSPGSRSTCSPTSAPTSRSSAAASRCSARSCSTRSTSSPPTSSTARPVLTNKTWTDAYRGAGRPGGDVRHRADDGRARRRGRRGPARDPREELDQARGVPVHHGRRARPTTPATTRPPPPRPRRCSGTTSCGPSRSGAATPVTASSSASASRRSPRCAAWRPAGCSAQLNYGAGGWEHASVRMLATGKVEVVTGASAHGQGHETAFSQIVADRLGVAVRGRRGPARRHPDRPQGPGHLRLALAGGRRRGAGQGGRQGDREGEADRGPPARGQRRRHRVLRRPVLRQGHRPGHGDRRGRDWRRSRRTTTRRASSRASTRRRRTTR